ncbi:hypothetical protein NMG60_11013754 [Bertholletia excelsa]
MANALFSFNPFNVNEIQSDSYESDESFHKWKQENKLPEEIENLGPIESFCSKFSFYDETVDDQTAYFIGAEPALPPAPAVYQPPPTSAYVALDDFHLYQTPLVETSRAEQSPISSSSLQPLGNHARRFKKVKPEKDINQHGRRKLSTEEIMRVAGARYIEFSPQCIDDIFSFTQPYNSYLSSLSPEETVDVDLAHLLLAAAEKVGYRQYERAGKLLTRCEWISSESGNPVQKVVHYFAQALRERIDRETGRFVKTPAREENPPAELDLGSNLVFLASHQEIPFNQVMQLAGIQAVLESVASKTKIHLIDLQIRSGIQWTALMQALVERVDHPVEQLKITAIGTNELQKMEETGKRLSSFAKSLNLPFAFKIILLSDMAELAKEHFEIETGAAVIIYAQLILRSMISRPERLECVMRVIKRLNPCLMAVVEVEANHNSPSFFNRFIEVLFFYSAYFDCLEECTNRESLYRKVLEGKFFRDGIKNMVAAEGEERYNRNVKMNVWRAFFERFGMVGLELSESALYQAELIAKQFACGNSCTLEREGKCLVVGWKGTPIHSLSIWKFR